MINIEELTLAQIRTIQGLGVNIATTPPHPYEIGKPYFIRTVTYHLTGRLKAVYEQELLLTEAAWIADDGRFADALKSSDFREVEPFPDGHVIVGRGSIIDAVLIAATPRSQK